MIVADNFDYLFIIVNVAKKSIFSFIFVAVFEV